MSSICDSVFGQTPTINNEAVNKDDITAVATNSRNKIVAALLRNDLEPCLGLSGSGQEVSIMRSTLIRIAYVMRYLTCYRMIWIILIEITDVNYLSVMT